MSGDLITDFRLVDEAGNLLLTGNVNPDEGPTGLGASIERQFQLGVKNGDFEDRPVAPDYAIGPDNVLPHWVFYPSVGDVLAYSIGDAAQGSGYSLEFRIPADGAAGDEAEMRQDIGVGSSRVGGFPDLVQAYVTAPAGNTGTFTAELDVQYLDAAGATIGSAVTDSGTVAAGASDTLEAYAAAAIAPTNARSLRIRLFAQRGAAAVTATGSLVFTEVRRTNRTSKQVFTADGTWTKPAGASWVQVTCVGGGGGGGSGRGGAADTNRGGGGSGGAGATAQAIYRASDLAATVAVTIDGGGAGGAAKVAAGDGNPGIQAGGSSFGSLLGANGGDPGLGGTAAAGGAGGSGGAGMWNGADGVAGGSGTGAGGDGNIGNSAAVTASGGGGGAYDNTNTSHPGGVGGVPGYVVAVVSAPASDIAGANITGSTWGGTAGGGGSSNQPGKSGGYGSGGGGGGGGPNASGAGGAGGAGYCAAIAW